MFSNDVRTDCSKRFYFVKSDLKTYYYDIMADYQEETYIPIDELFSLFHILLARGKAF